MADVLARPLAERPNDEFLVGRGKRVSYAEFDRLANRAATAFAALGVRAGDRVAMSLPTDVDIVVGFHGLLRLGAIWLGINRNLAPPEKRYLLADSGTTLAVGGPFSERRDLLIEGMPAPGDHRDNDDDKIPNGLDNCPDVANADQLDSDGTGQGDVCQLLDLDSDGYWDEADNCQPLSNPAESVCLEGQVGRACNIDGDCIDPITKEDS